MADIVIHDDSEAVGQKRKKGSKQIVEKEVEDPSKSNVIYVGRIPHGFYEKQMKEFFEQFGTISKLRISRNKQTGKSKHYGFIQFEVPEVAAIVAESMNNYLLMESMLQVKLMPLDKLHPKMWVGANRKFKVFKFQEMQRKLHNKVRTPAEQTKQLKGLVKKDKQRRAKLKAAGIDFNFPDIRDSITVRLKKRKVAMDGSRSKKIKIDEDESRLKKTKVAKDGSRSKKIKVDQDESSLKRRKVAKDELRSKKIKVDQDESSLKKRKVVKDESRPKKIKVDQDESRLKKRKVAKDESKLKKIKVAKNESRLKKIKVAKD
ncbi:unnamed protein product [Calypogeia fissa]